MKRLLVILRKRSDRRIWPALATVVVRFFASLRMTVRDQGGYTLVEMVSVLAIISVLSGIVIANTHVGDKRQELRDAVSNYVNAANQAESLASAAKPIGVGSGDTTTCPGAASCSRKAYGVCITAGGAAATCNPMGIAVSKLDTFQIYARRDAQTSIAPTAGNVDIIATYTLPTGLEFSVATGSTWIDFVPPGPDLLVNGGGSANQTCTNKTITVTIGGSATYTRDALIKPCAGAVYVK